ncbi:hypothetical protein KCU67_g5530, partial [Aureobasidium melanogenum]
MKLLKIGSTPDGPSTKSSPVSPIKPIGSGFSSPSRQTLSRMVLPSALTPIPTLLGLASCVYAADDTPGCFTLYSRFDDLRAAAASKTMFESALTTVSFTFVDHHEYFGHDHTNARVQAISAYDGQGEFTTTPKSMMNFNIKKALRKPCYDFYFL